MSDSDSQTSQKNESKDWQTYIKNINKAQAYPQNEYELAAYSIDSEQTDEDLQKFSSIVDRAIQLTNISDDVVLYHEQISAKLLISMFDIARREPALVGVFLQMYYKWRSALLLTNTKDGNLRKHVSAYGSAYAPKGRMTGYGVDLDFDKKEEQSLFDKVFSLGKKKKPEEGR